MTDLKVAAATVTIPIGPFITSDGTAVTAFTLSAGDIQLSKNGGAYASKNHPASAVHMANGWFGCLLDGTDAGTLGQLDLHVTAAGGGTGKLPVWKELAVVASNYWAIKYVADYGVAQGSVVAGVAQASTVTGVAQASTVAGVAQASALAVIDTNYAQASTVAGVAQASTVTGVAQASALAVINTNYAQASTVAGVAQASATTAILAKFPVSVVSTVTDGAQATTVAGVAQASTLATVNGQFPLSYVTAIGTASHLNSLTTVDGVAQATALAVINTNYAQASTVAGVAQATVLTTVTNKFPISVVTVVESLSTADSIKSYFPVSVVSTVTDGAQATTVAGVAQATSISAIGPARGVEIADFPFFMKLASDSITPASSLNPVGFIKKDSGTLVSLTNAVAEISSYGMYVVTVTSTEMTADKVTLIFTAAGADQVDIIIITT